VSVNFDSIEYVYKAGDAQIIKGFLTKEAGSDKALAHSYYKQLEGIARWTINLGNILIVVGIPLILLLFVGVFMIVGGLAMRSIAKSRLARINQAWALWQAENP
jgi:hypothetical protein